MKIETKEKIETFKQVVQGLFKLLVGVSILLSSIALYNHFKNPEVKVNPKERQVSEPEVSECDCEKYVKEVYNLSAPLKPAYRWCDYFLLELDDGNFTVRDMILGGALPASERVKDCDQ